jgi:hypothetical protein
MNLAPLFIEKCSTSPAMAFPGTVVQVLGNHEVPASAVRVTTAIVALFFCRGPFAILWVIAFVVIYSLDAVSCDFPSPSLWPSAHVCKEVFKSHPSLTDGDSSPSVIAILTMPFIETSIFHCSPNRPLWSGRPAFPVSVSYVSSAHLDSSFFLEAPTRFSEAIPEIPSSDSCCIAADADALPYGLPSPVICESFGNRESPESFSHEVDKIPCLMDSHD